MPRKVLLAFSALTFAALGASAVLAEAPGKVAPVAATAPATKAVDVHNTKCIVQTDDDAGDDTVEYQGKLYHVCCPDCIKMFKANPEKYLKAFNANPAAYGVKPAK